MVSKLIKIFEKHLCVLNAAYVYFKSCGIAWCMLLIQISLLKMATNVYFETSIGYVLDMLY